MLRLQADHSTYLLDNHPEIPKKIIEGLSSTLMTHMSLVQKQNLYKEYKNVNFLVKSFSSNHRFLFRFTDFTNDYVLFVRLVYVCSKDILRENLHFGE